MKALISPNEIVLDPNTQAPVGSRVCEIVETTFEVAPPLFWVDAQSDVLPTTHYYDLGTGTFVQIPEYVPPPQPEVSGAQQL